MMAGFWVAIWVLALVPLYFVASEVYKDGIVGRGALLCISFASWSFIMDSLIGGAQYQVLKQTALLVVAFAAFLCWHLWRFHSRVVKKMKARVCPPDCPVDRRKMPDRRFA